jgi:hypothetical protein
VTNGRAVDWLKAGHHKHGDLDVRLSEPIHTSLMMVTESRRR